MLETKGGFHLENLAYDRGMIERTISKHMPLNEVHRLEYMSLNDRVMGLITSSIKVLELAKGIDELYVPVSPPASERLIQDEDPEKAN